MVKHIAFLLLCFSIACFNTVNAQTADDYINRGIAKNDLKDYRGAIQDYNKAIEINPKIAQVYYFRGLAKIYLGDENGGCLDFSKAGELGDKDIYDTIKRYCN